MSARDEESVQMCGRITAGHCPACGYRGFVLGPQGAAAINIECGSRKCRSRYCVTMFAGICLFCHPIPKEDDGGAHWPAEGR